MATENSNPINRPEEMLANGRLHASFSAIIPFYEFTEGLEKRDVHDQLSSRMKQLKALLDAGSNIYGDFNGDTRRNYFWACSSLADEVEDLVALL